jgi:hypothetical protein
MNHYLWELGARVRSVCADPKQLIALPVNACFLGLNVMLKVHAEFGRDLKAFHRHVSGPWRTEFIKVDLPVPVLPMITMQDMPSAFISWDSAASIVLIIRSMSTL